MPKDSAPTATDAAIATPATITGRQRKLTTIPSPTPSRARPRCGLPAEADRPSVRAWGRSHMATGMAARERAAAAIRAWVTIKRVREMRDGS